MNVTELHELLDEVLKAEGPEQVATVLQNLLQGESHNSKELTIIANAGVHDIPKIYLHGAVYEASRGNWDSSTQESLLSEIKAILYRLAAKLRSQPWERVYLVPTGHPVLSLQIKAMVYRLLRFNTVDLYYKNGTYYEIDLDQRVIALEGSDHPR